MMTMKKKRITIQELMAKGQVIAPCVWDCFSASAAKYSGYEALLLSGAAVSWAYCGMPDIGLCTMEELVNICDHIADAYNMPIIVDADEGYGESPVNTYRTCQRLAKAGAAAITIDDGTGIRGTERVVYRNGYKTGIVDRETYYARIRAALAALEGTDCMLVARTISKGAYGIDEAIERVGTAIEMGAGMPLIIGMRGMDDCVKLNARVPGYKMYPDLLSNDGQEDVSLEQIAAMNYSLVTFHALEKGAFYGMIDYGKKNFENKSTVYSDDHDMGLGIRSWIELLQLETPDCAEWLEFERQCGQKAEETVFLGNIKWG